MSMELKLKLRDLSWLGQAFGNRSFISPLGDSKLAEFTGNDKDRLISQGIVMEDNTIKAGYYPMLETLAMADGFIDTTFRRGPVRARKQIITHGNKRLSVVYQGDEATVNMPANPMAMVGFISEYMGKSILSGCDLDVEMTVDEAFVLAGIADLYRKAVFEAYAREEVFVYKGFTKDELLKGLNGLRENSQSLTYHLLVINAGMPEFTLKMIEDSLDSLVGRGLLEIETKTYRPIGEALLFAGNFLIIENIIEVVVGQVKNNNLYRSNFMLLQAGPLDVLYVEKSKDCILMTCLSPLKAAELMAEVLNSRPDIV